ncbi:HAD-IIA family hydrolase [Marinoscillum sp. MHG1-6]|uniref:HAD-IIA family hydrolase n=1 Tax=Marinoscillum sp. MHG1-6 TaxID=2959627 RepID=UPI002158508C|nr:HAD-IIA family hydrolase [Marinoscillum sp. MHG1-6]
MNLTSFESIVTQYKTIFFDAFGVLKNHQGLLPGIGKTFELLERENIDFFVITNDSSKGPSELAASYQRQGLTQITEEKIVSSGMLAREYLTHKVKSGSVAYLGTPESAHYIEKVGLKTVSIKDLDLNNVQDINTLVFLDDEGFDWSNDLNKTVNLLRYNNITSIVCNTDMAYPVAKNEVAIAIGGIAKMVQEIVGKKFIRFGKPDAQMFIFAYEHALREGQHVQKNEILMVGDTLVTDILGGNKFGLDTALVLSGNTLPANAETRILSSGIIPTYVCESASI